MTVRVGQSVIDEINYLSYVMHAKSQAAVVSTLVTLVAEAVKAASADPDSLGHGGPILTREEQAAWADLRHTLTRRD